MKRYLFVILFIFILCIDSIAQQQLKTAAGASSDTDNTTIDCRNKGNNSTEDEDDGYIKRKKKQKKSDVIAWHLSDEYLGFTDTIAVDTAIVNFQNNDPVLRYGIENSYNGNLGSPIQSKIYFDNKENKTDYLFSKNYDLYTITPAEIKFYNTKTPFSLLTELSRRRLFERTFYFQCKQKSEFRASCQLHLCKRNLFQSGEQIV